MATPAEPKATVPLAQRPRSSAILDETFARIRRRASGTLPGIKSIFLSNYFNVIQLDDLSLGAAMNYCRFKSEDAAATSSSALQAMLPGDPLLLSYLFGSGEPDLLQLSLKTCLVSALSRKFLLQPDGLRVLHAFERSLLPAVRSAVVIGFGGYMNYLIARTNTPRIHVSDLAYRKRFRTMEATMAFYRKQFPHKTITISDGSDTRERLADADLVAITGSAFCSGTMEELLDASRNCSSVILQGQSASVWPEVLFERGVTMVSTTIKPENLIDLARTDQEQFRALLEGKLPPMYFQKACSSDQ